MQNVENFSLGETQPIAFSTTKRSVASNINSMRNIEQLKDCVTVIEKDDTLLPQNDVKYNVKYRTKFLEKKNELPPPPKFI